MKKNVSKSGILEFDFPILPFFGDNIDIITNLVQEDSRLKSVAVGARSESRIFAFDINWLHLALGLRNYFEINATGSVHFTCCIHDLS